MPARLGRYAVRRRIGSGGFATVWLAYDEQLDSPVAVKVLADNWTEDHHVRQRFLEEGRFLRKVESPYVVSVYDAGELDDGRPYLVMSYADQGTLADRIEVEGLTPAQAMEVIRQIGAGLTALHQRGVLHRDVKPANVLFRTVDASSGSAPRHEVRAMLGDLGLGKAIDMSSRLTMIAGTPSFVAPEQAQGERLDPRADQYSLAALTFLLLAGRAPYTHASLSAAARPAEPPSLSAPGRVFPAAVDDVVRRGLAVDREEPLAGRGGVRRRARRRAGGAVARDDAGPVAAARTRTSPSPATGRRCAPRRGRSTSRRCPRAGAAAGSVRWSAWPRWRSVPPAATAVEQRLTRDVSVFDDTGSLSVTVPGGWDRSVAPRGWHPPNDTGEFPALSVGASADWTAGGSSAEGVFIGILPGTTLPEQVPQHPECGTAEEPIEDAANGDESVTVVYTHCPGGVTVERVVRVTQNRLLWVQVRSADRSTANAVLDDVETHGI